MATQITKNYSVSVTFQYIDGSTITQDDLNVSSMRDEIKKRIAGVTNIQRGSINAVPGTVGES